MIWRGYALPQVSYKPDRAPLKPSTCSSQQGENKGSLFGSPSTLASCVTIDAISPSCKKIDWQQTFDDMDTFEAGARSTRVCLIDHHLKLPSPSGNTSTSLYARFNSARFVNLCRYAAGIFCIVRAVWVAVVSKKLEAPVSWNWP